MKFGKYLHENKNPDWRDMYLDYDALKKIIKSLEQVSLSQLTEQSVSYNSKCKKCIFLSILNSA